MGRLKLPDTNRIIEEAINNIINKYNVRNLRELLENKNFSDVINELEEEAFRRYSYYEKKAVEEYFKEKSFLGKALTTDLLNEIIDNSIITSIANERRSRAGKTVERILIKLLNTLNITCEEANIKYQGYKPDIIIPNNKAFGNKKKPDLKKVFVLAVKRTLRERWSEDIHIFNFPNSAFVLIKPDPEFTPQKAKEMVIRGMKRMYVPDNLYNSYKNALNDIMREHNVMFKPLSQLPNDLKDFLRQTSTKTLFLF